MLGREHDGGGPLELLLLERVHHAADLGVDEVEGAHENRTGGDAVGEVAAGLALRGRQLLRGRDRLEVHAEERRGAGVGAAAVVEALDLVDHRLDLVVVVLLGEEVVAGPVTGRGGRRRVRRVAVDLRGEQVVDAVARGTVEDLVRGVLVGPGGAQAGAVDDLEDRVHLDVLVGEHRQAAARVDGQLGGVDEALRVAGHLQDAAGKAGQALAGVEPQRILVELLEVGHLDAGLDGSAPALREGGARGQQRIVPGVVVVDAVDDGLPPVTWATMPGNESDGTGVWAWVNSAPLCTSLARAEPGCAVT